MIFDFLNAQRKTHSGIMKRGNLIAYRYR